MRTGPRQLIFKVVSVWISLVMFVGVLELALRLLPVSEGLRGLPVNDDNPVFRYAPHRTLQWSKGWNFRLVNEVRTNNYGFVSDTDYDPGATSPLLAVIGDSFVEAPMVPYQLTVAGRLHRSVAGHGRVYAFGSSGSALSQYLAYARYVRDEFHPDGMVFIIVGNDFDQSLMKYSRHPGFHYFVESGSGGLVLERVDRTVPEWKNLIVSSRLGLYVIMNLEAGTIIERLTQRIRSVLRSDEPFVGNVAATVETRRVVESRQAVDAFLAQLPSMAGLQPSRIALVVDAPRPEVYTAMAMHAAESSFFGTMRRYLIGRAVAAGFDVVDLEEVFAADYKERGRRFEPSTDNHWNAVGHELTADAIRRTSVYAALFQEDVNITAAADR